MLNDKWDLGGERLQRSATKYHKNVLNTIILKLTQKVINSATGLRPVACIEQLVMKECRTHGLDDNKTLGDTFFTPNTVYHRTQHGAGTMGLSDEDTRKL